MASHSLAIAKAALAAGLIRPDPDSISKSKIAQFHELLESLLKQCSSINIQLCKQWLLENVAPSASRSIAIGKYLVALTGSFKNSSEDPTSQPAHERGLSGRRKQLHVLYLLNDLFHHVKYHSHSSSTDSILTANIESHLVDLFGFTSAHSTETYVRHHRKVQDLLDLWDRNDYHQPAFVTKLRETVARAAQIGYPTSKDEIDQGDTLGDHDSGEERKETPYVMPASHGDLSTPFYDLPAGNMMPHIRPNATTPINPHLMKPLQFMAGPADASLVAAVKGFLRNTDALDGFGFEDDGQSVDIDEFGQGIVRDEITGDVLEGDGYYGWSRAFCERMKQRKDGFGDTLRVFRQDAKLDGRSSPSKRRYSDSVSIESGSGSRSRSLSARPRQDKRRRKEYPSVSRSRSRSSSLARGKRTYRSLRSRSPSISRSPSYSPPPVISVVQQPPQSTDPRPLPRSQAQGPIPPQPPSYPPSFSQGFPPVGVGGIPVPPPPPPNYNGPWPPPPPPISFSNNAGHSHSVSAGPLPAGLRTYHTSDAQGLPQIPQVSYDSPRNQFPQTSASWSQQQQSTFGESFNYGGRGRAQPQFNSNASNGRSRGAGRGGWA